jgi:hypothetical protein
MFSFFLQMRPELPITLALLALLSLRAQIRPKTSLFIKAAPAKVWGLIDVFHGKTDNWGRVKVLTELLDEASQTYIMTYTTSLANGTGQPFQAKFRIAEKVENKLLVLKRVGLEGKSENNELLEIKHRVAPEKDGARLSTYYHWGSRPVIAQLLARADLWGGAYRCSQQQALLLDISRRSTGNGPSIAARIRYELGPAFRFGFGIRIIRS